MREHVVGVTAALALGACGHSGVPEEATHVGETQGAEREPEEPGGLSVSGLRGTLSQYEIQNALEPRMPKFSRCVQRRSGEVEWVSGGVEFQFKIALDGSVAQVYPSQSSMGDRETERCMLEVAKGTRFPAPHGGEAEFSWSLEVPLDPDVRAPVAWGAPDAGDALLEALPELKNQCGGGPYRVTAYVDAGGKVVAAGAATPDEASAASLDCVAQQVQSLALSSPGSYAAKLSFDVE
jgi:hypothetical protein